MSHHLSAKLTKNISFIIPFREKEVSFSQITLVMSKQGADLISV